MDPYAVLGIPRTATPDEVKRAFHRLAHIHHPDKGGDEKEFKKVSAAYDMLKNLASRFDAPQVVEEEFHFHNQGVTFTYGYAQQFESMERAEAALNELMQKQHEELRKQYMRAGANARRAGMSGYVFDGSTWIKL